MNGIGLPASASNPAAASPRRTLSRIGFAAEVRIAVEHHACVRIVLHQHVGPGADRPPVEREVPARHAGLMEEAFRFPWHRREEGHREPVAGTAGSAPFSRMRKVCASTRSTPSSGNARKSSHASGPRASTSCSFAVFSRLAKVVQPDDVLGHQSEDRRVQPWVREAFDLVDVVVRNELARALFGQCVGAVQALDHSGR